MNGRLTALSAEASAANRGLHLLARACAPLIERCRLLATQKRLLTKMLHERPLTPVELEPVAAPLTDGLRALVAALDDSTEGTTSTRRRGDKRGGEKGEGGVREILSRAPRPLVSLRAVGIAMVAAQRFVRLAAFRASRRIVSTRREEADVPALHAAKVNMGFGGCCGGVDGTRGSGMVYSHGAKSLNDRCKYREDVIPLGPRGAGGVFMLEEAEVSPTLSPAAAAILDPGNTSVGSAAWACLGILDALICDQVKDGAWVRGFGGEVMGDGEPSLLRVLAAGQARHWRRLQERGLVPVRLVLWEADGREARIGGSLGTARVVVGRLARSELCLLCVLCLVGVLKYTTAVLVTRNLALSKILRIVLVFVFSISSRHIITPTYRFCRPEGSHHGRGGLLSHFCLVLLVQIWSSFNIFTRGSRKHSPAPPLFFMP